MLRSRVGSILLVLWMGLSFAEKSGDKKIGHEINNNNTANNQDEGVTYRLHWTSLSELPKNLMNNMPKNLDSLQMAHNHITKLTKEDFPDGCCLRLSFINLHDNYISHIDDGIFENLPNLVRIDLSDNVLKKFPNLKAKKLQRIELQTNLIESVDKEAMKHYKKLWHLDVGFNKIKEIGENTFEENDEMIFLQLRNNPLERIDEKGLPRKLEILHLDNTFLTTLPSEQGIDNLKLLSIKNVFTLFTIPDPLKFERLETIDVTYSMHCCAFEDNQKYGHSSLSSSDIQCNDTDVIPGSIVEYSNSTNSSLSEEFLSDESNDLGISKYIEGLFGTEDPSTEDNEHNESMNLCKRFFETHMSVKPIAVTCKPAPDAFNPCQDVMGTHTLRVFSWIISIFAIIGNLFQLVILFYSRQELSVYKLLMYNLGFGNLLMGMYLLVLCCVDTYTYGKYYNYVQSWQFSGGCQAFGFIAVFASQLSFISLVLITVERFLLIIFALQVGKQMKLRHAKIAVIITWVYSFIIAALPVTGKVGSYSKTAICLPMDSTTSVALAYIIWLLLAYIIGFFIIVACYVVMYFNISKVRPGTNSNTIDIQVAKRMALIIFSNFLCWLPISIAGFIAMFIDLNMSVEMAKFFLVFIFPLNACTNPFLYAIFTKVFRGDTLALLSSCGLCKNAESRYRNRAPSGYLKSKPKQRADTNTKHFMHYEPPSRSAGSYFGGRNIEAQTEFDSPETPIKVMMDPNRSPAYEDGSKPRSESTRELLEDHKVTIDPRYRSESNDTCSTGMSVQSCDSEVYNEFSRIIGSVKNENFLA